MFLKSVFEYVEAEPVFLVFRRNTNTGVDLGFRKTIHDFVPFLDISGNDITSLAILLFRPL